MAHVIKRCDKLGFCCKQSLVYDAKELVMTVDESDINRVSMAKYHALVSLIDRNQLETRGIVLQYPSLAMVYMISICVSIWEDLM